MTMYDLPILCPGSDRCKHPSSDHRPGGSTVSEFRGRVRNELEGSRSEGSYVDGERHGVWTYFDENGREPGTITFNNGRRVGG